MGNSEKNVFTRYMIDLFRFRERLSERACVWTFKRMLEKTTLIYVGEKGIDYMFEADGEEDVFSVMEELNPDAIVLDGYDDCILGIGKTFNGAVFIYDETKIINKLRKEMDYLDAIEFYTYNIIGGYYGEYSPIFFIGVEEDEEERDS